MLIFGDGPADVPGTQIRLRRWRAGDEASLIDGCGDAEVARWMPRMPQPYDRNDARHFLETAARGWESGTLAALAVVHADEVVGSVSFRLHDPDVPEVHGAYWAGRGFRGRGFIAAAVRRVSDWALGDIGVVRYELRTDPENEVSGAVARSAGFLPEGVLRSAYRRRDGRVHDLISWSRVAE